MKDFIADVFRFFKNDFFPNLAYYLLQIFLVVLVVLIFAGINIVVRFITDPICTKILRMKEHKRGPAMVGLVIATVITIILLSLTYTTFPSLRSTVIGWMGHQAYHLMTFEKLPDLEVPVDKAVPTPAPGAVKAKPTNPFSTTAEPQEKSKKKMKLEQAGTPPPQ